jgi:alpha-tubulin suppressor-like RCC1 family protein
MLVEALAGKLKTVAIVGAAGGEYHTAAWTEAGELFTFGDGEDGRLGSGSGGTQNELVPRLMPRRVDALAGKKVIGAAASHQHTSAWTETGELFTFGHG